MITLLIIYRQQGDYFMVDIRTSLPLYLQIASKIKQQIEAGDYAVGDRLPFESWYVDHFHASRVTVRKALEELVKEGIIERRPHQGLYVAQKKVQINQENSPIYSYGFMDKIVDMNSKILTFDTIAASSKLDQIFHCKKEKELYYFIVIRYNGDTPFALQSIFLKKELLPDLDIFMLKDMPLHKIIEETYQLKIGRINVSMSIATPTEKEAEALQVSPAESLLEAKDTLYLANGEVVRHTKSLYTKSTNYSYTLYR